MDGELRTLKRGSQTTTVLNSATVDITGIKESSNLTTLAGLPVENRL